MELPNGAAIEIISDDLSYINKMAVNVSIYILSDFKSYYFTYGDISLKKYVKIALDFNKILQSFEVWCAMSEESFCVHEVSVSLVSII